MSPSSLQAERGRSVRLLFAETGRQCWIPCYYPGCEARETDTPGRSGGLPFLLMNGQYHAFYHSELLTVDGSPFFVFIAISSNVTVPNLTLRL